MMREGALICTDQQSSLVDVSANATIYSFSHNNPSAHGGGVAICKQRNAIYAAQGGKMRSVNAYFIGRPQPSPMYLPEQITALEISQDGHLCVGGTATGKLFFWHLAGGQLLKLFTAHYGVVTRLRFTVDGSFVVSASSDGSVKAWSLCDALDAQRETSVDPQAHRTLSEHSSGVVDIACGARGAWVASVGKDKQVYVCSIADGAVLHKCALDAEPTCLAWGLLGARLFVGLQSGAVCFVPLYKKGGWGEGTATPLQPHLARGGEGRDEYYTRIEATSQAAVTAIDVTADDLRLLVGTSSGSVSLWDIATQQRLTEVVTWPGPIRNLITCVLPDVLPTEKQLAQLWPMTYLNKTPLTQWNDYAAVIPHDTLVAALVSGAKEAKRTQNGAETSAEGQNVAAQAAAVFAKLSSGGAQRGAEAQTKGQADGQKGKGAPAPNKGAPAPKAGTQPSAGKQAPKGQQAQAGKRPLPKTAQKGPPGKRPRK